MSASPSTRSDNDSDKKLQRSSTPASGSQWRLADFADFVTAELDLLRAEAEDERRKRDDVSRPPHVG